jgi:hypothetical protein
MINMQDLIKRALYNAGYECDPTEENLVGCFTDYVNAGCWSNLEMEDIEDFTVRQMCIGLIKL